MRVICDEFGSDKGHRMRVGFHFGNDDPKGRLTPGTTYEVEKREQGECWTTYRITDDHDEVGTFNAVHFTSKPMSVRHSTFRRKGDSSMKQIDPMVFQFAAIALPFMSETVLKVDQTRRPASTRKTKKHRTKRRNVKRARRANR